MNLAKLHLARKNSRKLIVGRNVARALLLAGLAQGAHGALLIDGFTTYQTVSVAGTPSGFKSAANSLVTAEALGGERDLYVERTSANSVTVKMEIAAADDGIASYDSGTGATGNSLIVWDGLDNSSAIATTGLGAFDLTQGGINNGFQLLRTSDLGSTLKLRVYQDATHVSEAVIGVPADPSFAFTPANVLFSDFTAVGASGGADFSHVGALSLLISGAPAGTDVGVESFSALFVPVPEASTTLAGMGMLVLLAGARGWKKLATGNSQMS